MEKAYLYEALYLVNHGIDEAVWGALRAVEGAQKLEAKSPLVQFPRRKNPRGTRKENEESDSDRKPNNGQVATVSGVKSKVPEEAHE